MFFKENRLLKKKQTKNYDKNKMFAKLGKIEFFSNK